jgi:hypothetical protein
MKPVIYITVKFVLCQIQSLCGFNRPETLLLMFPQLLQIKIRLRMGFFFFFFKDRFRWMDECMVGPLYHMLRKILRALNLELQARFI